MTHAIHTNSPSRARAFTVLLLSCAALAQPLTLMAQSSPDGVDAKKERGARKGSGAQSLVVAGVAVDRAKFDFLLAEQLRLGQPDTPRLREAIASELLQRELLIQEAKRKGLDRSAAVRLQQDLASERALAGAYLSQFMAEQRIDDAAVQKEYDELIKRAGNEEVLIRQILVPSLEDAKGVLARLNAGEKFEDLVAKVSRDASSRQQGGQVGWVPIGFLLPKVAEAVKGLSKGGLTKEPAQTVLGWHIIRLEDKRAYTKPTLDRVRPQIVASLQQRAIDQHVRELHERSKSKPGN